MKPKPYNNKTWTEARFNSFIKGALRQAAHRWGPRHSVKKAAWRSRGRYLCAGYGQQCDHIVPLTVDKKNNIFVDHIKPVVDPAVGFTTWDSVIERMFVEAEGLQVLCKKCHSLKTKEERSKRGK